ncbi:hypothetical protein OIU91_09885 [Streptomyces sp. NBC_01456]|uniref:hypothetical protein n=1 Tax=unclassified Streptomyces TaxID=2593676 RepID=UPI002E2EF23B|nr:MULTISPECIES: hypothetical protein [unclassified Streptomyces]
MSNVIQLFLGCTALAVSITARIAFRLALSDGATRPQAWATAGATALATAFNVCTVANALNLAHGTPAGTRTALTVGTTAVALALAYVAYDLTGPAAAPAGTTPLPGLARPRRLAAAASAFTGAFATLALILPLLH